MGKFFSTFFLGGESSPSTLRLSFFSRGHATLQLAVVSVGRYIRTPVRPYVGKSHFF